MADITLTARNKKGYGAIGQVECEVSSSVTFEVPIDLVRDSSELYEDLELTVVPLNEHSTTYYIDSPQQDPVSGYITFTLHNTTSGQPGEIGLFRIIAKKQ